MRILALRRPKGKETERGRFPSSAIFFWFKSASSPISWQYAALLVANRVDTFKYCASIF